MSRNPYEPPRVAIDDPAFPPMTRPRAVVVAAWLFWINFALNIVDTVLQFELENEDLPLWLHATILLVSAAIIALLAVKIWQGRNWARILALILALVSYPTFAVLIATDPEFASEVADHAWLYGTSAVLDIAALVLVFGPGRAWFRRRA